MEITEARLAANRANAARSKGPTSEAGKAASRRNSLKHGMTGAGVVLPEGDQAEVEARVEALRDELRPQSSLGSMLIRKIATLSVRSERAAERENAAVAQRVRHAAEDFDEARNGQVDALFAALPTDPRGAVRNLRRMPEGVDRLVEAWRALRHDLDREGMNRWCSQQVSRAANLAGVLHQDAHDTRIGDLSSAIWGLFHALAAHEGAGLDDEARRDWARAELLGLVDAQIDELEAHRETLDLDVIEQDRLEAPARATFDDSKAASLARRYEADADRGFYKALEEYRRVEAEATVRIEAETPPEAPARVVARVGSFREPSPQVDRERPPASSGDPMVEDRTGDGPGSLPMSLARDCWPPA